MSFFNKLYCILLFIIPFAGVAQDTALLKRQADRLAKATFKGDYKTVIDLTYPKLVELSGGRETMQKLMIERIDGLKKQGVMQFNGSVGSPGPFYNAGTQIHCLLPETITLQMFNGHYVTQSYLLAISDDKGKSWTFIDVGNMPGEVLHKLLPDYNDELVIPSSGKPMFFAD
ncbi:hypothetical protein GWR56_11970 [Mucilaginibacter sp. 14171R-50]|uniref:hypothetical protein n=1 Tax=Mucilaginibacter sp. 14171R-50 TaxID=2703789 RepID=UPI00138D9B21|nr:hypothetical protein [Mucilaginibacter sp. 14171R-50]QHS56216.1 hypothetical protein GWR56_11970 [Mucilaginibacter sp. 14171R-50]